MSLKGSGVVSDNAVLDKPHYGCKNGKYALLYLKLKLVWAMFGRGHLQSRQFERSGDTTKRKTLVLR